MGTWLTLCEVEVTGDTARGDFKSSDPDISAAREKCCGCLNSAAGRISTQATTSPAKASHSFTYAGMTYASLYHTMAQMNPKKDSNPNWSGCIRDYTLGSMKGRGRKFRCYPGRGHQSKH